MTLDSKDSDIERLRSQLSTLSVHSLDSTSISSGNDLDVGEGYPGTQRALPVIIHVHFCMYFLGTPSVVLAVSFVLTLSLYLPDWFFYLFLIMPLYFPPLISPHYSSPRGSGCSAHYSLPHFRINVLHLPAHTQIGLHRHPTQPSLSPCSLWLWVWRWRWTWRAGGAGLRPPGPDLWTAAWGWNRRWHCMAVQSWVGDENRNSNLSFNYHKMKDLKM